MHASLYIKMSSCGGAGRAIKNISSCVFFFMHSMIIIPAPSWLLFMILFKTTCCNFLSVVDVAHCSSFSFGFAGIFGDFDSARHLTRFLNPA